MNSASWRCRAFRSAFPMRALTAAGLAAVLLTCAVPVLAENSAGKVDLNFQAVRRSERTVDGNIERYNRDSPMEVIGATRAMYLAGIGLVYSLEVSLSPAVGISPFFQGLPPGEVAKIHQAKLARVPVLRQLLLTLLPELARTHGGVPDSEEIIMGATLFYFPYETRTGLPEQMVVRAPAGALRRIQSSGDPNDAARVAPIAKVTLY